MIKVLVRKPVYVLFLVLAMSNMLAVQSQSLNKGVTTETNYSILFVGNSLTFYNNLPALVEEEAKQRKIGLNTQMLAKPSYAIVDHWADGKVQQLVKDNKYDFVVIQQGPSSQADGKEMLINSGKQYSELCKSHGSQLVYFMVWPSQHYYHTFNGVIVNYTLAAQLNDALLCPVGQLWKAHFDSTQDFSYYGEDGFHPSKKGSEFAAKIIVDTLFKKANN